MQKNPVVFWELASHDQEKSVAFFRQVFDWQLEFNEKLGFYILEVENDAPKVDGGIFTLKRAKLPFLTIYIKVENIEQKAKLVEACGGFIVEQPHSISAKTKICLFNEPSGVTFAMIESIS